MAGSDPLRVLFVCGADFRGPSEKQVLAFSCQLVRRSHSVMISIGGDLSSAREEGADGVEGLVLRRHRFLGPRLRAADLAVARTFQPHIIHAFNSRHPVIAAARGYSAATGAPVAVHFEDDEWGLAADPDETTPWIWVERRLRRLLGALWPRAWTFSTRRSLEWSRRWAVALDAVTPPLAEHVSERLGRDCAVLFPMVSRTSPREINESPELPHVLRGCEIVALTGAIYPAHLADVRVGLRAVAELQTRGLDVAFVHCGAVAPGIDPRRLARECGLRDGSASFLGHLPSEQANGLLKHASVLIQPGRPTEFNRLRLPAKLHPYLASGRPTVTFATGFGELLADRTEVLKTHTGNCTELADRIAELLADPDLRRTLGENGPRAAARFFDSERNTDALLAYYRIALRI